MSVTKYPITTAHAFPSQLADANTKQGKDWLLQYCRAAMGESFITSKDKPGVIGWHSREHYDLWRSYELGRQKVDHLIGSGVEVLLKGSKSSKSTSVTAQINPKTIPIYPKFFGIAVNLILATAGNVVINPIDPQAAIEVQTERARIESRAQLREVLKGDPEGEVLLATPALRLEPGEPKDMESAQAAALGLRHLSAMQGEVVWKYFSNANKWDDVKALVARDLVGKGVACVRDDSEGPFIAIRHVDIRNLIVSPCAYPDFRDLRHIGEIRILTVPQLMAEASGQVSDGDMKVAWKNGIANALSGINISQASGINENSFLLAGKLAVLDLNIISTDEEAREERTNKYGNKVFGGADPSRKRAPKNGRVLRRKRVGLYRAKWIVGTDIIYDFGPATNQKRKLYGGNSNPAQALCDYTLVTADIEDMVPYGRTDAVMSSVDAMVSAWFRLQHGLNIAVPNGFAIDIDALAELGLTNDDGSNMSEKDILTLFFSRGILLYSSSAISDGSQMRKAVESIASEISGQLREFWISFQNCIEIIRQTMGLNEQTDASSADPKALTTLANMAAQGTNNALSDVIRAIRRLEVQTSESVVLRAQGMVKSARINGTGEDELIIAALGQDTADALGDGPIIDRYTLGAVYEEGPNAEQVQLFNEALQTAVTQGLFTAGDINQLQMYSNLKQRQLFLDSRMKANKEEQRHRELENIKANADAQQQGSLALEKEKQKSMILEIQAKMKLDDHMTDNLIRKEKETAEIIFERERIRTSGYDEASYIQAAGKDAANARDNWARLKQAGMDEAAEQIAVNSGLELRADKNMEENGPQTRTPQGFDVNVMEGLQSRVAPLTAGGVPLPGTEDTQMEHPEEDGAGMEQAGAGAAVDGDPMMQEAMMGGGEDPEQGSAAPAIDPAQLQQLLQSRMAEGGPLSDPDGAQEGEEEMPEEEEDEAYG